MSDRAVSDTASNDERRPPLRRRWHDWLAHLVSALASLLMLAVIATTLWFALLTKQVPFEHRGEDDAAASLATGSPLFGYMPRNIEAISRQLSSPLFRHYRQRLIAFPSAAVNGQPDNMIVGDYLYHPERTDQRLVIVLPIWGRENVYPVRATSHGIASRFPDTNVLRLHGTHGLIDWERLHHIENEREFHAAFSLYARRIRTQVIDIRRIIDWAAQQPEIDEERIAILGFSIGAIVGALAVANEPRLRAGVLVMGAVDPAEILSHCDGRRGRAREAVMERLGWDLAAYRAAIHRHFFPLDAMVRAPAVPPKHLLLIDARFDDCMPPQTRDALWRRLGKPARISLPANHRLAFLSMTFLGLYMTNHRIYDFLDARL